MYGSRKPDNWYQMDYTERQAWERQEQERQDLEYDKQRAQEEAERAQDEARRSRLNAQREMASMSEDYGYQIDDLNSQIEALKEINAELLDALTDALKTAKFEKQAFRPWHDKAQAVIAKMEVK